MVERRKLKFDNWQQVHDELHRLLTDGYFAAGKWNLEQMAKHLNDWITFPVLGFPKQSFPIRCMAAVIRNTIGPSMFKKLLKSGEMPAGNPTFASTVYERSESDEAAVKQLEASIERFKNHQGAIYPSPMFGPMDKASAEQLQFVHFAHHLSFLTPK